MILREVKIKNLRSYFDEQILVLPPPSDQKPIHLIGAPNGTGKTTLFQAIQSCLFSSLADPMFKAADISRWESNGQTVDEIEVEIKFEHESQTYLLNRRWTRKPGRSQTAADSVNLHSLLQNLDTGDSTRDDSDVADFIDTLIPREIGHFFLFDGEQIQKYTDSTAESVKDALERFLGLNLYIQLGKDMKQIDGDIRAERNTHNVSDDLNRKLASLDEIEVRLKSIDRERRALRNSASDVKKELTLLEREEDRLAAVFDEELQAKRRELNSKKTAHELDLDNFDNELKQIIPNELIVSWFWPEIVEAVEIDRASVPSFPSSLEELCDLLMANRAPLIKALTDDDLESLRSLLLNSVGGDTSVEMIAAISHGLENLEGLVSRARGKVYAITGQIDSTNAGLDRVSHELDSLPSVESVNTDVQELHTKMAELRTLQSRHESGIVRLEGEEADRIEEQDELRRDVDLLKGQNSQFRLLSLELDLSKQTQEILENFVSDYRRTRIEELEQVINTKFRHLTNMPDLYERVELDYETFEINLHTSAQIDLSATEQSSGQKEIIALSLIASVVEISNRSLPAIIDTPLARLDSIHKDNVLTRYFPEAGPQVIILATDTEIGSEEYITLERYIASEHHLTLDPDTGRTTIHEGYGIE